MSKEWQREFDKEKNPLENEGLTSKDKFMGGYYSLPFLTRLYIKKIKNVNQDVGFIEEVLDKKKSKYWMDIDNTGISADDVLKAENDRIESQLILKKVSINSGFYTFTYNLIFNVIFIASITSLMFSK